MNHPHCSPSELRHPEEESMPPTISSSHKPLPSRHLVNWRHHHRSIWTWKAQRIFHQHHHCLHHVPARHPLRVEDPRGKWWSRQLIISFHGELIPSLATPKGNLKRHQYCLTSTQQTQEQSSEEDTLETSNWHKYLGKLGTCESQVLIRAIHSAIQKEMFRSSGCSSGSAGLRVP